MMNGRRETINAPLNNQKGEQTRDPVEKANILLEQFSLNDNDTPPTRPEQVKQIEKQIKNPYAEPLNSNFSIQELTRSLSQLPDKAMGLDRIHNRTLKNLNAENRKNLLTTINLMFREGYIPKEWKCAIFTPILKPGKPPGEAESYRPI
jgi:hypothetical protein